jgi:hypothetical protein
MMDRIGEALKAGLLAFPDKNGPIFWPRFDIRESLASASRPAMHYAQCPHAGRPDVGFLSEAGFEPATFGL